jgi:hypothetical protein
MTNDEWVATIAAMPPQHRVLAEALMERKIEVLRSLIADLRQSIEALEQAHAPFNEE